MKDCGIKTETSEAKIQVNTEKVRSPVVSFFLVEGCLV